MPPHPCWNGHYQEDKTQQGSGEGVEEGTLGHRRRGRESLRPLWKTAWRFLKN